MKSKANWGMKSETCHLLRAKKNWIRRKTRLLRAKKNRVLKELLLLREEKNRVLKELRLLRVETKLEIEYPNRRQRDRKPRYYEYTFHNRPLCYNTPRYSRAREVRHGKPYEQPVHVKSKHEIDAILHLIKTCRAAMRPLPPSYDEVMQSISTQ